MAQSREKSQSKRSLKFNLIALTLGITLFLGVGTIGILRYLVHLQKSSQLSSFESYARTLSDGVAAQFFERYGDVQAFSVSPSVQMGNSKPNMTEMLNTWSAMYGIYDLIMVTDAGGHLVAVNSKGPDGKEIDVKGLYKKNYSKTPWFKAVMAGEFTEDKAKGFSGTYAEDIIKDELTSEVYGENRLGSGFSAAIKNSSGRVVGVVTNRAGSRWFEAAFRELYANLRLSGYAGAELSFLSKDGTLFFEHTTDTKYNWESLLKFNLAKEGVQSAQNVLNHKSGALVERHKRKGIDVLSGYAPVTGAKFIESLGWSVVVRDSLSEAMEGINHAQVIFYIVFAVIIGIACASSYWYSVSLSKKLSDLASNLSSGSNEVHAAAASISEASTELSAAATEQSSSIQQTASAADEVSSMARKSADNASQSQKVSQGTRQVAEQGQAAVQEMSQAIRAISESNTAIMTQVGEGNRKISEIVKVISEIGEKTKVINDIVFQTKLLSFNASVEAARAGEHGKGFAVVAEEVGNLAQMSGNAAKEISAMLEVGIQRVQSIVVETKSSVEKLVEAGRAKVEDGEKVVVKCEEVLNSLLVSVQEVDSMVGEIASASQEQSQGVTEINQAMSQLNMVTQQNNSVAQSASVAAEELTAQSRMLRGMVQDLMLVVHGRKGDGKETDTSKSTDATEQLAPSAQISQEDQAA